MGSNSSTLVISIAIGILLLLILLLLLSYNSKAESDKIERFEDNEDEEEVDALPSMDGFYGGSNGFKNYASMTTYLSLKYSSLLIIPINPPFSFKIGPKFNI